MAVSTAYVNQILPKDAARVAIPGHVIQVVSQQFGSTDYFSTSTSFTDIVSLSITPAYSNSKIICEISGVYQVYGNSTTNSPSSFMTVLRNGVDISGSPYNEFCSIATNIAYNTIVMQNSICLRFTDSPSTTSSVTYKWQHKQTGGARVGFVEGLHVQLMEIAQ